jgi:hypothetical protein
MNTKSPSREGASNRRIKVAWLNATHSSTNVAPDELRQAVAIMADWQDCTMLQDQFYDVSCLLLASRMQCASTPVAAADHGHESCYLSASSDATRTRLNFLSCSASGQSPFTPSILATSTLSARRPRSLSSGCLHPRAPLPRFRPRSHQRVRLPDAYGSTRDMPRRTSTNTTRLQSVLER